MGLYLRVKPWFLRLHRWVALLFAIPLAIVFVTGLILSVEPVVSDQAVHGRSVTLQQIEQVLEKFDPQKKMTTLNVRAYDHQVILSEGRTGPSKRIHLGRTELVTADDASWSVVFTTARRMHENFLLDLGWLVTASTIATVLMIFLGLFMGWPFWRNSLGGWHRAGAWTMLPLLVLSPLTGLALAWGITFNPPPKKIEGPIVPLRDAIKVIATKHDLANVIWVRPQGGATRVRVYDKGEAKTIAVTSAGLVEGRTAWPRVLHEGVWAGRWSGLMNVLTALAFIGLMITGITLWAQRTLMRRRLLRRR